LIHLLTSGFVFLIFMTALPPAAYGQPYDGTFNNTDWVSQIIFFQTGIPFPISAPSSSLTIPNNNCQVGQHPTGNPSPSRRVCTYYEHQPPLTINELPPAIWVAHIYQPFTYTPATQGPIASVSFSYDLNPRTQSVTHGLLILQNGVFFRSVNDPQAPNDTPGAPVGSPTWKHIEHIGFTADEFRVVDNLGNDLRRPDFCNGGPIQFGYVTGTSSGNHWSVSFLDNWKVDIKGPCLCLQRIKETIACGQSGGSYVYTVQLKNLTTAAIPQISVVPTLPAGVTVTPQMFPVALAINGTTTLTMTISNVLPGATVVLRFLPSGVATQCCPAEIRVPIPAQGQC
jgi:hypothetical protein